MELVAVALVAVQLTVCCPEPIKPATGLVMVILGAEPETATLVKVFPVGSTMAIAAVPDVAGMNSEKCEIADLVSAQSLSGITCRRKVARKEDLAGRVAQLD